MHISQKSKIRAAPRSFSPDYLLQQTDELLNSSIETKRYMINRNNTIFSNPIDMTKDGYIFPVLPYPYTYVKNENDDNYHVEFLPSKLLTPYTPTPSNIKPGPVKIKKPQIVKAPLARPPVPTPVRSPVSLNAPGPNIPAPGPSNKNAPGPINALPRISVGAG